MWRLEMKIYFAGAIRGGRELQPTYSTITEHLENRGHTVLTTHVAVEGVLEKELLLQPQEIFSRDIKWLDECQLVVADVTIPSLGVGYEISSALTREKPVLCIYRQGTNLSAMINGNRDKNITVCEYDDDESMLNIIDEFILVTSKRNNRKHHKSYSTSPMTKQMA